LLGLARSEDVSLFSSLPLLAELTGILSRSKFEKKIAASRLSVDQLVDLYAGAVALVRPISTPRLAPDPDDDVVIGTALAARADFLVTGDRALLSVAEYEGGRIVSVSEALHAAASS
jgi:putative PIN family toxin of toxin-antitoxin system